MRATASTCAMGSFGGVMPRGVQMKRAAIASRPADLIRFIAVDSLTAPPHQHYLVIADNGYCWVLGTGG